MVKHILTSQNTEREIEYMGENEKGEGFFHLSGECLEVTRLHAIKTGCTLEEAFEELLGEALEDMSRFNV